MSGRRVVITGGASGIGKSIALGFTSLGDQVCICDKSPALLESLKLEMPETLAFEADVTNEKQLENFFEGVSQSLGGVDILISNAGTSGPAGKIEDLNFEEWQDCLSVNLNGAFLSSRFAAKSMRRQQNGVIIFISSTSGLFGVPNRSPYVTAKWGLIGLTKALAMELGPAGVRVNAICPGSVYGERMTRVIEMESIATGKTTEYIEKQYQESASLKRFVTAEDIAKTTLFLASEAASQISGQALAVDGNTERMI
ncbi:MAG: SDR family oxidoreductase [Pseudomonadota bacterium]|nr:SDR family oxidoreductase [Pseudomonadota bacterium]